MAGDSTGTIRITHFRVERELGRDGLGYVFHATDEQLERPVALRVARASARYGDADVPAVRLRFREDARRAAAISHPNLVTIFEFRALAETDLVVMELVEGETLAEMQARGVRWTVLDAARTMARLSDALAAAHDAGLVHGRVRASNIKVRPDGRIKLLDLGVPRETDELADEPTQRDDVRALARLACQMLAPTAPAMAESTYFAALRDPVMSRARFGFLAPVLQRAIGDDTTGGFRNAGEFRDALVTALDAATYRASPDVEHDEARWSTRVVGPDRNAAEDRLPADGRALSVLGRVPGAHGGRRLALPPDLAAASLDEDDDVPVPVRSAPRNGRPGGWLGARRAVALAILAALAVVAWLLVRGLDIGSIGTAAVEDGTEAGEVVIAPEPGQPVFAGPPEGTAAAVTDPAADTGAADVEVAGDAAATDAAGTAAEGAGVELSAMVRGSPAGTAIRVAGDDSRSWTDAVELSVARDDSIVLNFSRPGYVPQRHVFRGSRIAVSLEPDSVVASFQANTPTEVILVQGENARSLGTTPLNARLPTGIHRITFRAPGHDDWTASHEMAQPGQRYTVSKNDYVTIGNFVATVNGTWAWVSVDGGPDRETPARFEGLSVGPHVVRVTRDGYQTIVDTVTVRPGQAVTRQYTLRR